MNRRDFFKSAGKFAVAGTLLTTGIGAGVTSVLAGSKPVEKDGRWGPFCTWLDEDKNIIAIQHRYEDKFVEVVYEHFKSFENEGQNKAIRNEDFANGQRRRVEKGRLAGSDISWSEEPVKGVAKQHKGHWWRFGHPSENIIVNQWSEDTVETKIVKGKKYVFTTKYFAEEVPMV